MHKAISKINLTNAKTSFTASSSSIHSRAFKNIPTYSLSFSFSAQLGIFTLTFDLVFLVYLDDKSCID